jgi:hypothetical protein
MSDNTDNRTILLDTFQFTSDILGTFSILLSILGKGLLLGAVPVLIEATLGFFRKVFSPNSGQRTKTAGGFDVTNNTDNNHGGSFDNSDGFDDFLLVHLGTGTLKITNNVGHTSFVTHESSQVDGLLNIVLGISLDTTAVRSGSLTGTETQVTVTGSLVFSIMKLISNYASMEFSLSILNGSFLKGK